MKFSAQLWKFNKKGILENKMRPNWHYVYDSKPAEISPKDSTEGFIQIQNSSMVLTFKNNVIGFDKKETPLNSSQKWKLGRKDQYGWHTIQHSDSKKYLTTRSRIKFGELTMEPKSKFYQVNQSILRKIFPEL